METSLILLLVSVLSCVMAFDSNCPVEDREICMTVMSNQMNITEMREGMDDILSDIKEELQKNREDMKALMTLLERDTAEEASKFAELETCFNTNFEKSKEKAELEEKRVEVMQATQRKLDARDRLQEEVDSLGKKKEASFEKIKCLKEQIKRREELITNLHVMAHTPVDCADLKLKGMTKNGVYTIHPMQDETTLEVQCDFTTDDGGWTVFLNRVPQINPVDFSVSWDNYKKGVGEASGEYMMGLDFLHILTSYYPTSLRFEASNFTGSHRVSQYSQFKVDSEENKYKLTVEGYQTDSTMNDNFKTNNNCFFSTKERDNDKFIMGSCAAFGDAGNGGWWYSSCGNSRLTGPLINSGDWASACVYNWDSTLFGTTVSLKKISLKFRRHNYEDLANVKATGVF